MWPRPVGVGGRCFMKRSIKQITDDKFSDVVRYALSDPL
jgi:hypothetical protein